MRVGVAGFGRRVAAVVATLGAAPAFAASCSSSSPSATDQQLLTQVVQVYPKGSAAYGSFSAQLASLTPAKRQADLAALTTSLAGLLQSLASFQSGSPLHTSYSTLKLQGGPWPNPVDLPAAITSATTSLDESFGDISGAGQRAFIGAGLGYGRGVYGGSDGTIDVSAGPGGEVLFDEGAGFEQVFSFLGFGEGVFPANSCAGGAGISVGAGGDVGGGVALVAFVDGIEGFTSGVCDYTGGAYGSEDALDVVGYLAIGAGVSGSVGTWVGVPDDACASSLSCPATSTSLSQATGMRGATVGVAVEANCCGAGASVSLDGSLSTACSRSPTEEHTTLKPNDGTLDDWVRYQTAGWDLASEILQPVKTVGQYDLTGAAALLASALPAAAIGTLYGLFYVDVSTGTCDLAAPDAGARVDSGADAASSSGAPTGCARNAAQDGFCSPSNAGPGGLSYCCSGDVSFSPPGCTGVPGGSCSGQTGFASMYVWCCP